MTLQQLTPQGWVDRAKFLTQDGVLTVADVGDSNLTKIMTNSLHQRIKMGMPVPEHLMAT